MEENVQENVEVAEPTKTKIFCFCIPLITGDFRAYAVDESGKLVRTVTRETELSAIAEICSSKGSLRRYARRYPDGYEVHWNPIMDGYIYSSDFISAIGKCREYIGISVWDDSFVERLLG